MEDQRNGVLAQAQEQAREHADGQWQEQVDGQGHGQHGDVCAGRDRVRPWSAQASLTRAGAKTGRNGRKEGNGRNGRNGAGRAVHFTGPGVEVVEGQLEGRSEGRSEGETEGGMDKMENKMENKTEGKRRKADKADPGRRGLLVATGGSEKTFDL